ncbi:unnamed protein product [Nezara viridula]|uniref:glutaminase n=1 Tax=Nezara viridula TaxID=85310 RepID=A0A9P0H237_NEZVI|nr:unnamed protein product [Nezara viridula]
MTDSKDSQSKEEESKKLLKKDQVINVMYVQLKNEDNKVPLEKLFQKIKAEGVIIERDYRLQDFMNKCRQFGEFGCFKDVAVTFDEFYRLVEPRRKLISGCVTKRLKIEDFMDFSGTVEALYDSLKSNITGQVSDEFPDLESVDVNKWGVAICSVDGQRKFIGDSDFRFTMQNICKPLLMALVLKTAGIEVIKKYIAFQPNNVGDDILELNTSGKPFNAMANSGALMLCALLTTISFKGQSGSFIHDAYVRYLKKFIGDEYLEFKASSFISKLDSADELRCMSFGVTCTSLMPPGYDTNNCLDLFIKVKIQFT